MDRNKLLLAVIVAAFFVSFCCGSAGALAADAQCSQGELRAGLCAPPSVKGSFGNGGVDLSAGYQSGSGGGGSGATHTGSRAGSGNGKSGSGRGNGSGGRGVSVDGGQQSAGSGAGNNAGNNGGNTADLLPFAAQKYTINCKPGSPCDPTFVVRMSDLVNFRPIAPTQGMEPDGWTVIGLPTNFFAAASAHTLSGSLLGFPANVRFTPVGYRWDYGDGTSRYSATGGSTWAAQNLPEFSETNTSHSYRETGNYAIRLTVEYAAGYRFAGQAWQDIGGTLAVPAAPLAVVAAQARTVLVDRECTRNPGGPGC